MITSIREGELDNVASKECEKVEEPFFLQKFDMQIVCERARVLAAGLRFFDGGEKIGLTRARGHSKLRPRPWPRTRNLLRAASPLPDHTWATRACVGAV